MANMKHSLMYDLFRRLYSYYRHVLLHMVVVFGAMLCIICFLILILSVLDVAYGRSHWHYPSWTPIFMIAVIILGLAIIRIARIALRNLERS